MNERSIKMKPILRKISVLLMLCLLVMSFAACTKKENSKNDNTGSAQKTTAKATAATTAKASSSTAKSTTNASTQSRVNENNTTNSASEDNIRYTDAEDAGESGEEAQGDYSDSPVKQNEEISYDLKGRKIIYATPNISYTYEFFRDLNEEFNMWTRRINYVEEKYNCDIEVVPYPNPTEFANTLSANALAGTYWADIIMVDINMLMKNHVFMQPLDEWIDFSNPKLQINPGQRYLTYNGKNYCIQMAYKLNGNYFILYNRDITDREGMPDILELQRSGQWTWEKFVDIAVNTTRDLNGDGITDQWGLTTQIPSANYVRCLAASNGSTLIREENGTYTFNLDDPKALKAIFLLNDLQNVHKAAIVTTMTDHFQRGKSTMLFADITSIRSKIATFPQNSTYVLFPKGPDVNQYYISHLGGWSGAMPYSVKDPDIIAKIIYDINSIYDNSYPEYLSEPDVRRAYENYVFSELDFETLDLAKNITMSGGMMFDPFIYMESELKGFIFTNSTSFYQTVMTKNVPVQTAFDITKNEIKAEIDKISSIYQLRKEN